jgi:hypothetical protein
MLRQEKAAPPEPDPAGDTFAPDGPTTVFRAFVQDEFLEWPAWTRLRRILDANGGSYGLSGPRGAGKSWLMLRAICWAKEGARPGIGLWYPSPSEYRPLDFLASLSDSLANEIRRWFGEHPDAQRRLRRARWTTRVCAVTGFAAVLAWYVLGHSTAFGDVVRGLGLGLVGAGASGLAALLVTRGWRRRHPEERLLQEARVIGERARWTATRREGSEIGAQAGSGIIGSIKRSRERELVERPATLSSLVHDFRALAELAGTATGGRVVIAIDELDKMADPGKVRELLRDIKGIFEVPGVRFLVSVSDEAARNLSLGALTERNEFNSSFYTVLQAQPPSPDECAELLQRRGGVPREVALVLAVLAGGNPREVVRLAELAGQAATGREAAMKTIEEEALTLRREIVTALELEGVPPVTREARIAAFRALPDDAFEEQSAFEELCRSALSDGMWEPKWRDPGWAPRFDEAWSRLMVRLAVAGELADSRELVRDEKVGLRLRDVVTAAGQSAAVARIILEGKLRVETRHGPALGPSVDEVRDQLTTLARAYEGIRSSMPAGKERTQRMDKLASDARAHARTASLDPDDVIVRLRSIQPGDRVVALAAVQATADPATADDVLAIAADPATPFEQYHALRALESLRPNLSRMQRVALVTLLEDPDWNAALNKDRSRTELAGRLLAALQQEPMPA